MEALAISAANLDTIERNLNSVANELTGVITNVSTVNDQVTKVENQVNHLNNEVQNLVKEIRENGKATIIIEGLPKHNTETGVPWVLFCRGRRPRRPAVRSTENRIMV